ncbi:hypothetical protein [Bacillus sp. FJAT-49736]|uniref:hypothetical protein n=1 Tax=Bacillus sp. FJAT-49736 TaxID=2833582 RepID=UPI001BC97625|nr:hypothetical protein [Bacillus sp. FJAT-49736]MBS4174806.1 hypothetical protein [Bacillus sp. FJAT-49736]MBS4175537.1 hypothetical protein [Bacillus sp. FJAT-49736]
MNNILEKAVLNNVSWCGTICETHGIQHFLKENIWSVRQKAPTYYPEVITVSRITALEVIKEVVGKGNVISIKDSYAKLDMTTLGFELLFAAEWIFHAPVLEKDSLSVGWKEITSETDLKKWTAACSLTNIIRSDLLRKDNVKIFLHENNDGVSGFIANFNADVVGISNVFSNNYHDKSLWREIPIIISTLFPGIPIVGYEHGDDLFSAKLSGWSSLGPLLVWIKK